MNMLAAAEFATERAYEREIDRDDAAERYLESRLQDAAEGDFDLLREIVTDEEFLDYLSTTLGDGEWPSFKRCVERLLTRVITEEMESSDGF